MIKMASDPFRVALILCQVLAYISESLSTEWPPCQDGSGGLCVITGTCPDNKKPPSQDPTACSDGQECCFGVPSDKCVDQGGLCVPPSECVSRPTYPDPSDCDKSTGELCCILPFTRKAANKAWPACKDASGGLCTKVGTCPSSKKPETPTPDACSFGQECCLGIPSDLCEDNGGSCIPTKECVHRPIFSDAEDCSESDKVCCIEVD